MRTWMTRSHTHSSTCPTPHHTKGRSNQPSAQAWIPQYIARPDTHNPFTFSNRMADLPAGCKVERGKEWRDVGPRMCPKWPPIPYVGCNLMRRRRLSDKSLPGEYRCLISTKPGSGATYWPWLWPTCLPEKRWMLLLTAFCSSVAMVLLYNGTGLEQNDQGLHGNGYRHESKQCHLADTYSKWLTVQWVHRYDPCGNLTQDLGVASTMLLPTEPNRTIILHLFNLPMSISDLYFYTAMHLPLARLSLLA